MPRVSVVIPTFNRGGLLLEAVRSALAQTFTDIEVIVADDGSTDGSIELAQGLGDERVRILRLPHSGLPARARNAALAQAGGELVAFLDSDDVWYQEKLERQVERLDRDPAAGLICSNARVIDLAGNEIRSLYLDADEGVSGNVLAALLKVNFVITSSAITRRDLAESAAGFAEDARLRGVEDYELWLRIAATNGVVYLAEPLLSYRRHDESVGAAVPASRYWASVLAAITSLDALLDVQEASLLRQRRAELCVEIARTSVLERKPAEAMRSLGEALRLDPKAAASHVLSGRKFSRTAAAVRGALRGSAVP